MGTEVVDDWFVTSWFRHVDDGSVEHPWNDKFLVLIAEMMISMID